MEKEGECFLFLSSISSDTSYQPREPFPDSQRAPSQAAPWRCPAEQLSGGCKAGVGGSISISDSPLNNFHTSHAVFVPSAPSSELIFDPAATAATLQRQRKKMSCKVNDGCPCLRDPRARVCFCSVSEDANMMHLSSSVPFQKLKLSCCQIKEISGLDHCNHHIFLRLFFLLVSCIDFFLAGVLGFHELTELGVRPS